MKEQDIIASGLLEQYVLGLCHPEEITEIEGWRKTYPGVNAALLAIELQLEKRHLGVAAQIPAAVDDKVGAAFSAFLANNEARAHAEKSTHKPDSAKGQIKMLKSYRFWAAAAMLAIVALAAWNLVLQRNTKTLAAQLTASTEAALPKTLPAENFQVLKNPAITPVGMLGVGTHAICRCTLFWDKKTGKVYVMIHHLVKPRSGKSYQLWAMVDGKPKNLGILDESIRDRFIELAGAPVGTTAFAVTLEEALLAAEPNMDQLYLQGKI